MEQTSPLERPEFNARPAPSTVVRAGQSVRTASATTLPLPEQGFALNLQASTLSHRHWLAAAMAFASEIALAYRCQRVTLGSFDRGHAQVQAASNGNDSALVGDVFDAIAAAMEEAADQGRSVYLPPDAGAPSLVRLAHSRLLQRQGGAVACIPLVHEGEIFAVLCCEWALAPCNLNLLVNHLENVVSLIGPVLHLMRLRDLPFMDRLQRTWDHCKTKLAEQDPVNVALLSSAAALGIITLLFIPMNYRVGGQAHIEGEIQRALVAPTNGFLKSSPARAGDHVSQGQLLFELADEDLQLLKRKWESELAQQENAYASAAAGFDRAQMVIALAKADEARAQLDLVQTDLNRSRITAPFDGIVIQGDLNRTLGAPVERGSVLMVLAPNDRYRTIVQIDERDIRRVHEGQVGLLSLSALPWDTLQIRISRITPVAHTVEGNNVFDVEAEVIGDRDRLAPGLQGVAKVVVGRRSLAWIWTHRFAGWAHQQIWNWLP